MAIRSSEHSDLAEAFVGGLEALGKDRAALASLKRCAGRVLGECPQVFPLYYRLLPSTARGPDWLEEPCFLVATLFPLSPTRATGSLGHSLRSLMEREPKRAEAIDRRLTILLDCSPEELPFRLRQVSTLLAGKDVGIDWRQLLVDLLQWNLPGRPVQKRWARAYFGADEASSSTMPAATHELLQG